MSMFTDANEAANWVMNRTNYHLSFEQYSRAMAKVGHPENQLKVIHVAGTNGKGSVCYGLAHSLMALGYKVGMFTSPHLESHRDRIRINDAWIDEATFVRLLNHRKAFIETEDFGMFQIDFLLACDWFLEEKVDYAIMEVGIGGLLDSTNTITHPELSVITGIGMDHMAMLGNTIKDIAAQKAGIIKPHCPVVIGRMPDEARQVMVETALARKAVLHHNEAYEDMGTARMKWRDEIYDLASLAQYQKQNMALVLNSLSVLGLDYRSPLVKEALAKHAWAGRFEVMSHEPMVVIDGAHNMDGMNALVSSLKQLPSPRIAVFSALRDKQGPLMHDLLKQYVDEIILTAIDSKRADTPAHLNQEDIVLEDFRGAITLAEQKAGEKGSVLVCGSLYLISDVRRWLKERSIMKKGC